MSSISEKIIDELAAAKIVSKGQHFDKAQLIIRRYLSELHNEAVQQTIIACNKPQFTYPKPTNL